MRRFRSEEESPTKPCAMISSDLALQLSPEGQNDMGGLLAGAAFHWLGERELAERAFDRQPLGPVGKGSLLSFKLQ